LWAPQAWAAVGVKVGVANFKIVGVTDFRGLEIVGATGLGGLELWASQVFAVCNVKMGVANFFWLVVTGFRGLWAFHRFSRFVGV